MQSKRRSVGPRLRVYLEPDIALGPGKAALLLGIKELGSIAAAGRRMGMSYKRAWNLVKAMNAHFKAPLVETSRGGRLRGGATLTATGESVLACYRSMEIVTAKAIAKEMRTLRSLLRDTSKARG